MKAYKVPVNGYFEVNSYFWIDERTGHGFLIDPGAQGKALVELIREQGWTIEKILLTHGHFDHTGGIEALRRELDIPVYIHENGAAYLEDTRLNLSAWCGEHVVVNDAHYFQDDAVFSLAGHASPVLTAIHTPGHTPDSTTFYNAGDDIAFVGDTIFKGSIGNDQYPGGNRAQLLSSIQNRIFTLPEETVLYSGHSDPTTVGTERRRYF